MPVMPSRKRITQAELQTFRELIRSMKHGSLLFKMLSRELSALGYWRLRARGKPGFHRREDF